MWGRRSKNPYLVPFNPNIGMGEGKTLPSKLGKKNNLEETLWPCHHQNLRGEFHSWTIISIKLLS